MDSKEEYEMVENNLTEVLVEKMEKFFMENGWQYEYDEGCSMFIVSVAVKCKLKVVRVATLCRENGLLFRFVTDFELDDNYEAQVIEYIARANDGVRFGGFQMDFERKVIEYVGFVPCEDVPSNVMIDYAIWTGVSMWDQYCDNLLAVNFGMQTAKDAVEEVRSKIGL